MARVRGFGELEATVMDRLWNRGTDSATTVREIFDELGAERHIAYTTVMSTMDNLHRKQWLERDRAGKAYRYWPTMTREERSAGLMRAAIEVGGDTDVVLTHFLQQMSADDSARLTQALQRLIADGAQR